MNKLLRLINTYSFTDTALVSILLTTLLMLGLKALGYAAYSWLAAFSPVIFAISFIGVVNFLAFLVNKED